MRSINRFRGCLIGGAAGDALGYAVEFQSESMIFSKYGQKGITEYELRNGVAEISDDTQMSLFTATGLLYGTARGIPYNQAINNSYIDWLQTQERQYPLEKGHHTSWLVNVPELFSRRAPGNTCMASLESGGGGTPEYPINHSKGCGGVMRVAPIGLYFNDKGRPIKEIDRLGAEAAALTHGHALGWLPAAALVHIIQEVTQDNTSILDAVLHALNAVDELWPEDENTTALTNLIKKAIDLTSGNMDDLKAIHSLGEGWVGDEALAIAVYCALKYPNDFERAIVASVNHRGDSDSTGAITGYILGAKVGLEGIPQKYIRKLELKDVILQVADDLYGYCLEQESVGQESVEQESVDRESVEQDPEWIAKYVEASYSPKQMADKALCDRCRKLPIIQHDTPAISKPLNVDADGCILPYVYSSEIKQWKEAMDYLGLMDKNYIQNRKEIADKAVEEMNMREVLTMMTSIIRGERFCMGTIAAAMESGVLPRLSLRLRELIQ